MGAAGRGDAGYRFGHDRSASMSAWPGSLSTSVRFVGRLRPGGGPGSARRGALAGLAFVGLLVAAVFLVVTAFASAQGCTDSWTGGAGTSTWDTGGNWSKGVAPKSTDSVCITLAGKYDV